MNKTRYTIASQLPPSNSSKVILSPLRSRWSLHSWCLIKHKIINRHHRSDGIYGIVGSSASLGLWFSVIYDTIARPGYLVRGSAIGEPSPHE
ncbi:unnamed protein product [Triticum turgidum subsp. durum]|uniref:Uncharacterized protein n=1 Tax=Triticum turgidum subsp. durum TaxID=4567 RepID=A0A9R0Q5F0_TRITD|nr:unnamed protein product [Triticum turgidum subsp. durum]